MIFDQLLSLTPPRRVSHKQPCCCLTLHSKSWFEILTRVIFSVPVKPCFSKWSARFRKVRRSRYWQLLRMISRRCSCTHKYLKVFLSPSDQNWKRCRISSNAQCPAFYCRKSMVILLEGIAFWVFYFHRCPSGHLRVIFADWWFEFHKKFISWTRRSWRFLFFIAS